MNDTHSPIRPPQPVRLCLGIGLVIREHAVPAAAMARRGPRERALGRSAVCHALNFTGGLTRNTRVAPGPLQA